MNNEGEWTADQVEAIAVPAFIECRDGYQEVADAHNAALAAERGIYVKQREDWIREIQQLQEQLTAERGNAKAAYKRGEDFARNCCAEEESEDVLRLEQQLASERESHEKELDTVEANYSAELAAEREKVLELEKRWVEKQV